MSIFLPVYHTECKVVCRHWGYRCQFVVLDYIDMRCFLEISPGGFHVQMEAIIAWQPPTLKSWEQFDISYKRTKNIYFVGAWRHQAIIGTNVE